ncbi:MAG: GNAT family N-acetyltransferase [Nanoarchaeota archaeon]|nr:GNAT family N-acetyltransferase [Nanoarchaeota archaeon]
MVKKIDILPKNKRYFKKLIPFAQRIIQTIEDGGIPTIVYGSFAHFYHTKDKTMNVNDIDIMVPEHKKNLQKISSILKKSNIKHNYYPKWETLIIKKGMLKVEVDGVGQNYKTMKENSLFKFNYDKIDFYGLSVKLLKLNQIEEMYSRALIESDKTKLNVVHKVKLLEKFLDRKIKGDLKVDRIKSKDLNRKDKKALEELRVKEFGEENRKDFKKDYESDTLWVVIKKKGKIVSFGGIRPIKVKYKGRIYHIGGICSTISVIKKKGYGKIMVNVMKDYSQETGKTILGFTGQTKFFSKCGFGTKKNFVRRFVWVKPNGEKVYDDDGDGIYYEGRDKLISKILKTKSPAHIFVEYW